MLVEVAWRVAEACLEPAAPVASPVGPSGHWGLVATERYFVLLVAAALAAVSSFAASFGR